jgi:outer membrane protein assembly factor BamA
MNIRYLFFFLILSALYSCSATKFVPEGEYLLDRVKIESDIPGYKTLELRPFVRQLPNNKMFGLNRTMLQIYNLAGKDSSRWVNRFIRRIGEPPVIFDSTLVYKTDSELQKLFVNMGYINVDVSSTIVRHGNRKAEVSYLIVGNEPYRIRNYTFAIEDTLIRNELFGGVNDEPRERLWGELATLRTSLVRENNLFDRNVLDTERGRITHLLRNRGFFAFAKDNIIFDADTSLNANAVDLDLRLRRLPPLAGDSLRFYFQDKKYHLDKVSIYLDYDPLLFSNVNDYPKQDSIVNNDYTIFHLGNRPSLRARTLTNNTFLVPGRQYSQLQEELTYSSFANLNALNNIHIQFNEKVKNDSAFLDVSILTMPARKQAISFSVEGTNTAGDLGVASSVNYIHRNLFRGGETLNLRIRGAYEAISNFSNPYLELGGEASIHIPKFIIPFNSRSFRRMRTSTEFSLRYNSQNRPEYDRRLLSGGIRYQWQGRNSLAARHQLDLLDVDYIYLPRTDSVFMNNLPPSAKYFGYTNHFIVGTSYSYYRSTFDPFQKQKDAYSFRFSVESAGNVLYGLSYLFNREKDDYDSYQLLGNFFAQFIKTDFDYAKTTIFDKNNSFAWRIGGGIGIPYGNSKMLPFEKRYYSGGANSVRAWSVRELGPGSYVPDASTTFFNQSGDIKLDLNIEYRTRFFWKLEAAAFIDAGNIWTIQDYKNQENGKFKFDSFYKEIALGYGAGLRLDFDYFLIRFDCGWKAYNPAKSGKDKWAMLRPNFGDNFAWHIAVGYPF